jgi:hypothetical protein
MPQAEIEPAIPPSERPHTHVVDRAATGIGVQEVVSVIIWSCRQG